MAFTKQARDRLQKFVKRVRGIIEDDFCSQLQSIFGMDPETGTIAELSDLRHLNTTLFETASDLREIYEHYLAQKSNAAKDDRIFVLRRILREQTQTTLHRLCAVRMAEERGVLMPSLSSGMQSTGFLNYQFAVGVSLGSQFAAYEKYLKSVFDELAQDLPQIFDRTLPFGLLFLREKALTAVLAEINAGDLCSTGEEKSFWAEDETIGWIFQYFNSDEDFSTMRGQQNKNPRNSYELAVRNQFFTPRYVVEFLIDNTLGRLWAESTNGRTRLLKQCRSLLLDVSESQLPVMLRDPRSLRILDPACGSMHFGLYAFDVLETIYEECWDWEVADPEHRLSLIPEGELPLRKAYDSKAAFLADVPRLIIKYNLYGVDIDVRATQIASLALWLRAQRSLQQQNIPAAKRPSLGNGNVVAAVAPPPEKDLARTIESRLTKRAAAGYKALSEGSLSLIPETGILLPLERSLASVQEALVAQNNAQQSLLGEEVTQLSLGLETTQWENQRDAVRSALNLYIEEAGHSFQEQLFVRDAMQCLKLIDLCTLHFDAIVMNPPFGSPADGSRDALGKLYPSTKKEIIGMFVLRMLSLLSQHGCVGAISSRTIFFQGSSERWRERTLFGNANMPVFLDLGPGVMDNALVEAAAYVLGNGSKDEDTVFINALHADKALLSAEELRDPSKQTYKKLNDFVRSPGKALAYNIDNEILHLYDNVASQPLVTKQGLTTGENERFIRINTEVESASKAWIPLSKGGEARPFYGNVSTVINWSHSGEEIKASSSSVVRNEPFYARPALTWTLRANSLELREFPRDGIFDRGGNCVFVGDNDPETLSATSAILNSRAFQNLIAAQLQMAVGNSRYECGMLSATPFPKLNKTNQTQLAQWADKNFQARQKLDSVNEESRAFLLPEIIQTAAGILDRNAELKIIADTQTAIDVKADEIYGLHSKVLAKQEKSRQLPVPDDAEQKGRLISWAVGVAFGRFDLRLALGERAVPESRIPFTAYPERAPGRLPEDNQPFISNNGIFVMDPAHPLDLTSAVRAILKKCGQGDDLDVETWLKKEFFSFHLKLYSAANRIAPIYWPVGTTSGSYTLWFYYPRLSADMLYAALNNFVEPRLEAERRLYAGLQSTENKTTVQRQELEKKAELISELDNLRNHLHRLAEAFTPHFDDGVAIDAVRFMPLIQSKEWLKRLEKTKAALEAGSLDWSETAADLYPDRVKQLCRKDPSIRLAHKNRGWFPDKESGKEAIS